MTADPVTFKAYREAETLHASFAKLGTVGYLTPELLSKNAGVSFGEPMWFKAGAQIFSDGGLNYLGSEGLVHAQSILAVLSVQAVLRGGAEAYRASNTNSDISYPGGFFDLMGMSDDPNALAELKVKELKNGRLAMFSMLGYYVQGLVTRQGPVENWASHIADPTSANVFAYTSDLTMFASAGDKLAAW